MSARTTPTEDLVFDVGMHRGEDTEYYLLKGYRVVAFEANPELVEACRARFGPEIAAGRLTIVEGAIADSRERETVFYRPAAPAGPRISALGSTDPDWMRSDAVEKEAIRVPTVDFAACLERHGVPWYMKVDIEGADRLCLEALAAFEARPAYVSTEAERADFRRLASDLDLLESLGYDRFMAVRQEIGGRSVVTEDLAGDPVEHRFERGSSGAFGDDLPGRWIRRRAVQRHYRRVFRRRRLVRRLSRTERGRRLAMRLYRRFPSLGLFFDTHARHGGA